MVRLVRGVLTRARRFPVVLSLLLIPSGAETQVFWGATSDWLHWVAPTRPGDLELSHGATAKVRENAVKQGRVRITNAIGHHPGRPGFLRRMEFIGGTGGKMKPASARRISSHADGPDVARARGRPATSAPNGPISSARSVPRRGKAPGWSCPGATPTPWRRTSSRSVPPSIPAPMRC